MNRELLKHPSYYANAQPERPALVMADSGEQLGYGALMYLHGGGFKMGSLKSHHDFMARLSQAADCCVLGRRL